jgi:hypothetical protein
MQPNNPAPTEAPTTPLLTAARVKVIATILIGVMLPLFSLWLSYVAGCQVQAGSWQGYALGAFAVCLMGCCLAVSLNHLAWAIGDITRSPRKASWALAVAFDLILVLGELCHVAGPSAADVGASATVAMGAVCCLSQFLNCWAFLFQKNHPRKAPAKKSKGKGRSKGKGNAAGTTTGAAA